MKIVNDPLFKFDEHSPLYNFYYPIPSHFLPPEMRNVAEVSLETLLQPTIPMRGAWYVHIPFCETLCSFCPFVRAAFKGREIVDRYVDALIEEMRVKGQVLEKSAIDFRVINFGGGTPSILDPEQLRRIGKEIAAHIPLDRVEEFSFECEVKSVTAERMEALAEIGVTRITFGIQTFNPKYRELFNLTPTIDEIHAAIDLMKQVTSRVGFDLLYGFHGQSTEDFIDDLRQSVALGLYNINLHPIANPRLQPILHKRYREQTMLPKSAAETFAMRLFAHEYLTRAGYRPCNGHSYIRPDPADKTPVDHVTISPEYYLYQSLANGYHDDATVGFGVGAHTYTYGWNSTNELNRRKYIEQWQGAGKPAIASPVSPQEAAGRSLILYLPYNGFVEKGKIDTSNVEHHLTNMLDQFIDAGLVYEEEDAYRLTPIGWYWYVNLTYMMYPPEIKKLLDSVIEAGIKSADQHGYSLSGCMRVLPD